MPTRQEPRRQSVISSSSREQVLSATSNIWPPSGRMQCNGMDDGPSTYHLNLSTLQVTFSEPIDATSVGPDDLQLSAGRVTRAEVLGPNVVELRARRRESRTQGEHGGWRGRGPVWQPHALVHGQIQPRYRRSSTWWTPVQTRIFEYGATGSSLDDQSWSIGVELPMQLWGRQPMQMERESGFWTLI